MDPIALVKLSALMARTSGSAAVKIGLIDGPVATGHPDLVREHLSEIPGRQAAACARTDSTACLHGTFVAGILAARRSAPAPAICPACTLLIRPVFPEATFGPEHMPSATPGELAAAIVECIDAGARIVNLSLALLTPSSSGERSLTDALNRAIARGVIVAAAAGNHGTLGGSAITSHPWVIPVVACDLRGTPIHQSNLGHSIGRRGIRAPGDGVTSLGAVGQSLTLGGTSVATPFVSGAAALLWSAFPAATAAQIKAALIQATTPRRHAVVPPLLDVEGACRALSATNATRSVA